jgi:predicted sugar kinase
MNHKLQSLAVTFLLAETERYLARSLEGYRRASILDAQDGDCAASYDDAYDDLGRCTDASLAAARAIVATDPDAWHDAILASETDNGAGAGGVEVMCRTLGSAVVNGETIESRELPYCGPLLRSDAANSWRRLVHAEETKAKLERSERITKENKETTEEYAHKVDKNGLLWRLWGGKKENEEN